MGEPIYKAVNASLQHSVVNIAPIETTIIPPNATNATPIIGSKPPCTLEINVYNMTMLNIFAIIFCLSVLGNSVVIVIITQQRWMRTITNVYLLNLALADLMLSVICMPPTLTGMLLQCFVFPSFVCPLLAYLQPVAVTASLYTLMIIAIERYYAICRPLHSRHWQTKSHAWRMIGLVWLISFTCNLPAMFTVKAEEINKGQLNCRPRYTGDYFFVNLLHQVYITVVLFLIPAVVMVVLYALVIKTLRQGMSLEKEQLVDGQDANNDSGGPPSPQASSARLRSVRRSLHSVVNRLRTIAATNDPINSDTSATRNSPKNMKLGNSNNNNGCAMTERRCKTVHDKDSGSAAVARPLLETTRRNTVDVPDRISVVDDSSSRRGSYVRSSQSQLTVPTLNLRSTHAEKSLNAKKRVIVMLVAVVIEFFICWTPLYCILMLMCIARTWRSQWLQEAQAFIFQNHVYTVALCMAYISSCCNPITYCFLNEKFRLASLYAFGCASYVPNAMAAAGTYRPSPNGVAAGQLQVSNNLCRSARVSRDASTPSRCLSHPPTAAPAQTTRITVTEPSPAVSCNGAGGSVSPPRLSTVNEESVIAHGNV